MSDPSKGQAGVEVEVTPEMIAAGAAKLFELIGPVESLPYDYEEIAEVVFKTMLVQ